MKVFAEKWIKNFIALLIGSILSLILAEIVLRLYNPLPTRIKGNSILLISNFKRKARILTELSNTGLDSVYTYSTNSLGLRGDELPAKSDNYYKILTVGGSTTECSLLDDSITWPQQLNIKLKTKLPQIWLNNAGIDGTSTYGHQILLEEHLLNMKPNMIVFLMGINDLNISFLKYKDDFLKQGRKYRFRYWMQKSELFNFIFNFYRLVKARRVGIGHGLDVKLPSLSQDEFLKKDQIHINNQINFKQRVQNLINICTSNNIAVCLITQTAYNQNQHPKFQFLKYYNNSLKELSSQENVFLIDLQAELENHNTYYYDEIHYTKKGAKKVSQIIYDQLKSILTDSLLLKQSK